jgi:hypothetical protein
MAGYTKLFSTIVTSTIWEEPHATKVVWVTMLALADRDGVVESSIPGLARLAGATIEETTKALGTFTAPDTYSRTKEHEGRRIEEIAGGWRVLNHGKYRDKLSKEDIREQDRLRQQRHREKNKNVTERDTRHGSQQSRQAEADAEASKPSTHSPRARDAAHGGAQVEPPSNSDTLILEVAKAHPRYLSPAVTQSAIANEAERLAATRFHGDARKALQFLLQRTLLYRKATMAWPQAEHKFICGSDRWYSEHKYDEDEALWEINHGEPGRDTGGRVSRADARENANVSAAERVIREEVLAAEKGGDHGGTDQAGGGDQRVGQRRGPEDLRGHARGHAFRAAAGGFRTR